MFGRHGWPAHQLDKTKNPRGVIRANAVGPSERQVCLPAPDIRTLSAEESDLSSPGVGEESTAMSLSLAIWNVECAKPNSRRTTEVLSSIHRRVPEGVCLTETHVGLLSQLGHMTCSQPDYGNKVRENRRKVMLWSRKPRDQVDDVVLDPMAPGRFVCSVIRM